MFDLHQWQKSKRFLVLPLQHTHKQTLTKCIILCIWATLASTLRFHFARFSSFVYKKTCDFKQRKHHQRGQYSNDASAFSSPFTFCIVNLFTHPCTYYYHGFCSKNPLYLKWWWWWWRLPSIQRGNLFNKTLQTFSLSLWGCLRSRFFSTQ